MKFERLIEGTATSGLWYAETDTHYIIIDAAEGAWFIYRYTRDFVEGMELADASMDKLDRLCLALVYEVGEPIANGTYKRNGYESAKRWILTHPNQL